MRTFRARRRLGLAIFAALAVATAAGDRLLTIALRAAAAASGWLLLATVALLAAYNIRKRLPSLPLGVSSAWLQVHLYAGALAIVLFALHSGGRLPRGPFEVVLAGAFLAAALSGVAGIALSRIIPPLLTAAHGEEVIFERIPILRERLRARVEELAERAVAEAASETIPAFYCERLAPFFAGPRNVLAHLLQSRRPLRRLLDETEALRRYLDEREHPVLDAIEDSIRAKDALDRHYAMQGALKAWLFVHVPSTAALLVLVPLHVVLARAFGGGVP